MAFRLIWSPSARFDLKDIAAFMAEDGPCTPAFCYAGRVANLSHSIYVRVLHGALRRPRSNENRRWATGLLRFARNDTEREIFAGGAM